MGDNVQADKVANRPLSLFFGCANQAEAHYDTAVSHAGVQMGILTKSACVCVCAKSAVDQKVSADFSARGLN